jgi:hypothetical protein
MEQLQDIYKFSGYPAAQRLYDIAKSKGIKVTVADVKAFVKEQTVAQLFKKAPAHQDIPISVDGARTERQMDLLDLTSYARANQNFKWILIVENVWDRRAQAQPIKTKSPADVLPALKVCIQGLGGPPLQIVSDSGSEWLGSVKTWLATQNIHHRRVEVGDHRSLGLVDSLARFVKNSLSKHFTSTQKTEWLSYLQPLIEQYNSTPHSSLKQIGHPALSPDEASKFETDTRNIHTEAVEAAADEKTTRGLKVGEYVRVLKRKKLFDKGYEVRYSAEVYTIVSHAGIWYTLSNGQKRREGELQRVSKPKEKEVPKADVAKADKRVRRTEVLLKSDGIVAENKRVGSRARPATNYLEDDLSEL